MQIQSFFHQDTATFTYIVADQSTKKCAIIDSVQDFDLFSGKTFFSSADMHLHWIYEQGYTLEWILETHIHADHLTAASYLKEKTGAKIAIGSKIIDVLQFWVPFFANEQDTPIDGSQFDHLFEDHERFNIGNLQASVLHTPGHTPACASYHIENAIFVGDTIFMPYLGTARADFPGGSAERLYDSIHKILALPEDTRIYSGHDYPANGQQPSAQSTVKEQKLVNIMVNDAVSREEYCNRRNQRDKTLAVPKLLLPSIQINMRCGNLGSPGTNGTQFIKLPLNKL